MSIDNTLAAAIERLYSVYADYPLAWWSGPYCCTSRQDEKTLHSTPLRELTGADLQLHESHYFLCGRQDVEGFKHLLPRSFELLANGESYSGPEVLMNRLQAAGWLSWPSEEQDAVTEYMVSVWRVILSDVACEITAEDWLVGLATAGLTLEPLLEIWESDACVGAAGRLAEIIAQNQEDLAHRELGSAYWDNHAEEMAHVADWLLSPPAAEMLQPALYSGPSEDFMGSVSEANGSLRSIQIERLIGLLVWRTRHLSP